MKSIILTTVILAALTSFSQTNNPKNLIVNPLSHTGYVRAPSSDSFDFCGSRFPTFRDCVEGSWKNCCDYALEPFNVSCANIGALVWSYMPSVAIAEMNIKNHISDLEKEGKVISKETIYCNVLGNRVKTYHVKRASDRLNWSDIRMGAIVNGQAVLLELTLFKRVLTNQQIPPIFRQIITLAE